MVFRWIFWILLAGLRSLLSFHQPFVVVARDVHGQTTVAQSVLCRRSAKYVVFAGGPVVPGSTPALSCSVLTVARDGGDVIRGELLAVKFRQASAAGCESQRAAFPCKTNVVLSEIMSYKYLQCWHS